MYVEDSLHRIQVSDQSSRNLYRHQLPDAIKTKLAFIESIQVKDVYEPSTNGFRPTWMTVYTLPTDKALHDVGWRVMQDLYCLVLDGLTIDLLKGRTLTEEQL